MTRGVAGTELGELGISEDRTENGGSAEDRTRPTSGLVQISALSQARLPQNIDGPANDSMMGDRCLVVDEKIDQRVGVSPRVTRMYKSPFQAHTLRSSHVD